ncbi:hypothetical protein CMV_016889 [Castanea mollissima]|uniref:Uncharacterized protein n=1 Tax=Castanea mollissima TaxID=60419 RepID=A0A8J4VRA0_9ROSI|nr:hypothetical protein CMV_016889 [Castanea mollissima]
MGTQLRKGCFALCFAVILISFGTNMSVAAAALEANPNFSCDATIAECNGDEELLMESEVSRRILADGKSTYNGLKPEKPFCNAQLFSNCIEAINMKTRPCTMYNRCQRGLESS